uniref:Uncharacterized protein n=1 Tax=Suricata suricatta TaxID=37032 RepID=A0A673UPL2_SURSU
YWLVKEISYSRFWIDGSVYISLYKRYACSRLCRKHCSRFNRLGSCPPT